MLSLNISAQERIPELITDRPDQTESSTTVPLKSLQIETGFLRESKTEFSSLSQSYAYNTSLLRYGLFDNLEFRLGWEYLGEKKATNPLLRGSSPLYTGFKIKINEESGLLPEIAFLGGLVLPFTANTAFKTDQTAGNMRFSMSHTLSEKVSIGYNLGAEWDGNTAIPGYYYSLVFGLAATDKIGIFTEAYGLIPESGQAEHLLDAGFTFLVFSNLQLDLSGGIGLSEAAITNFISFGLTYRLDRKNI